MKNRRANPKQTNIHAARDDKWVHGPHVGVLGWETLCGYIDTYTRWDETDEPVNCPGCLSLIQVVKEHLKAYPTDE